MTVFIVIMLPVSALALAQLPPEALADTHFLRAKQAVRDEF